MNKNMLKNIWVLVFLFFIFFFYIDFYVGFYRLYFIYDYMAYKIDFILYIHSFQEFYKIKKKIGKKFMVKVKKKIIYLEVSPGFRYNLIGGVNFYFSPVFGLKLTGDKIDLIREKKKKNKTPVTQAYKYNIERIKNFVPNIFSIGSLLGINYEITENFGINLTCKMNITKVYGKRDVVPNHILSFRLGLDYTFNE